MAAMLHPFRALRDSLQQIGAAINASQEYSRAGKLDGRGASNGAVNGIPL